MPGYVIDPYAQKREAVREALPAAGWQELRGAVEKLLDLAPAEWPTGRDRDELDAAGDDGFWSCHAAMVAILAYHLGLDSDMSDAAPVDDRLAMLNDLLGGYPSNFEIHEPPIVRRIKAYRMALITGARCDSDTVTGGCARYPHHSGGHSAYPLPGDPGYQGSPVHTAVLKLEQADTNQH